MRERELATLGVWEFNKREIVIQYREGRGCLGGILTYCNRYLVIQYQTRRSTI